MRPLLRHLLMKDVPVLVWGAPNLVRHEGGVIERDYPTLRRQYVQWLIIPGPRSRLPLEAGKMASEKLLMLVTPSCDTIQKV